jgi:5-formyltetrahydrofolate cyclo-ligase
VTDQVLKLPEFQRATRIGVYLSMPRGEISTGDIVKHALMEGKKVFVPCIQKASEPSVSHSYMEMFALHSQDDLDNLQPDSWRIPTLSQVSLQGRENALGGFGPSRQAESGDNRSFKGVDLILLPGMAFDRSGGRLGHGKGFYDRFLQGYREIASQKNVHAKMPFLGMVFIRRAL